MGRTNRKRKRPIAIGNSRSPGASSGAEISPELKQILNNSRVMTANGTEPRRHHLVPRFYLDRWAEDNRVRVTDLNSKQKSYVVAPNNALVETDYYRVPEGTVKDGSPVVWEVWLSKMESKAAAVFRAIDSGGLESLDDTQWNDLLVFLGVQITRSRAFRYKGRWMSGPGQYQLWELDRPGAIEALLTRMGEDATPERVAELRDYFDKVNADPSSVPLDAGLEMDMSIRSARGLAETLSTRQFLLFETAKPLMTCDEPIVELYEHMGVSTPNGGGVYGAPIIVFPFGPTQVLALFRSNMPAGRKFRLSAYETLELNRAIAGNAHRHLVENPASRLGSKLFIPELKEEPIRIVSVPVPSGEGDFIWTPIQRRWHGCSNAPIRPVASWWPHTVPPPPPIPRTREEWNRERIAYFS